MAEQHRRRHKAHLDEHIQDANGEYHYIGAWYAGRHGEAGVAEDTAIAEGPYAGVKLHQVGERLYRGGDAARAIEAALAELGPGGNLFLEPGTYPIRRTIEIRGEVARSIRISTAGPGSSTTT